MTKKIYTSYATFLCMAVILFGSTTAQASEVTGTLSSDTASSTGATGDISGTVTGGSGGSSGGGGGSSGSRRNTDNDDSSANEPTGTVSGATTVSPQTTPNFPNAGFAPEEEYVGQAIWSKMATFLKSIFSF